MRTLSTLALIALAAASFAQVKAIKAGRMVDTVAGKVLENQTIVIRGSKITEVGRDVKVPVEAEVIDLTGYTVLPGLIDCHTHLLSEFDSRLGGDDVNGNLTLFQMNTTMRVLLGAKNAREYLEAGVTTVRDVGNSGVNGDVALRDAINRGWLPGCRIICSTRAISSPGGQFGMLPKESQAMIASEYVEVSGVEEARRAVRRAIQDGADLIKVIVDTYPAVLSPEELNAIVEEAHRVGRKVAAHCITAMAQNIAAEAGVDSIEHAYMGNDKAFATMAKKHIFLVPTDTTAETVLSGVLDPERRKQITAFAHLMESSAKARIQLAKRLGIPIAFGSDMYYAIPGLTRGQAALRALESYAASGMSAMEIIQSATSRAADLCGRSDRIGSLAEGRFADIVAVRKDPLKDIAVLGRIDFVMKGGAVVRR